MLAAGEPSILHTNRAFCYGDAIFETIHGNGTRLQFFESHYQRLEKSMKYLGMEKNSSLEPARLESAIIKLLNKNHFYNGVRIRLTVFRDQGGLYTPATNSCSFLVDTTPLDFDQYRINEKGLRTVLFTSLHKPPGSLSNLKTANSLLYIMAGLHKKETGMDDCFILNTEKRLSECISSNIFLMINNTMLTPALSEGCVDGIMRREILRIAEKEGIKCRETRLGEQELLSADECFLTSSITGIRWVVAYGQKRYYSKTARRLISLLNHEQFG
jgi:branched-subunit amino acid aminotransferase/4-amino-4-deoxychorismate lyase